MKNCFKATSTDPQHLSTPGLSIELFSCFLMQSWHLLIARWIDREISCLLDSYSIYRGLLDSCPTPLDPSRSPCFSHGLHVSLIFVSIASYFSFSCRSMVPCSPCSLFVSFLSISCQVFWLFIPFDNRVKKGDKFDNWMSFLRRSNRLRGRTSC